MPLRVLIIGGSGFLSGTLARVAIANGCAVTVVTRGQRPAPAGADAIVLDRKERARFARRFGELDAMWDVVVDAIPYTPEDARQDVEVFGGNTLAELFCRETTNTARRARIHAPR